MTQQEQKEQKAVEYLRAQIDFGNPEVVLRVYKQVLSQGLFETQIGLGFLRELHSFLMKSPEIPPAEIPQIAAYEAPDMSTFAGNADVTTEAAGVSPVQVGGDQDATTDREALEQAATREAIRHEAMRIVKRERALAAEYQKKMYMAIITAVVCFVMMIAMLVITLTSNLPTVINYREKIIDEYSSWEQELNEREQALQEREAGD